MTLRPCHWGRVLCHGRHVNGQFVDGCGAYDLPARDLEELYNHTWHCLFCGSTYVTYLTLAGGMTTRPMLQPTKPVPIVTEQATEFKWPKSTGKNGHGRPGNMERIGRDGQLTKRQQRHAANKRRYAAGKRSRIDA